MSHFIGLVFVDTKITDIENLLAPFNERDDNYYEFFDCTEEVEETFNSLPDKDEDKKTKHPCDKEHYPTIKSLAEDWFGYEEIDGKYGHFANPNAKYDWYQDGGWGGFIYGKDGDGYNSLPFNDIDWDAMLSTTKNHIPDCFVDMFGLWFERGNMGWWGISTNEKPKNIWDDEFKEFINSVLKMKDTDKENIVVYAVDFHI